jgi:hypothetical protein
VVSGTSSSNPSIANNRHPRRNDPRAVPNAPTPATGEASPATGPQTRSNSSGNTLRPRRLRAWVIADAVGTAQAAFQQPHRSNDPVTLVATSS